MEKIRVGIVGLGGRGKDALCNNLLELPMVEVTAVCDLYEDRVQEAGRIVYDKTGKHPLVTKDFHEVTTSSDVDAVVVTSAWESHLPICVEAMENGKYTATEVGGAYSLQDCFRLVETYEKTGIHCMMLENCNYDRNEMMVMRMVREGLFGEIVHCDGGYMHDLRDEITHGEENRHYRLRNYRNRNCENYPTHALGPIAKILDINRGNRMVSLSSTASCARGLREYVRTHNDVNPELLTAEFTQGDIVTTVIRCAHGQTITLTLDTTLPRNYSRNFTVRGTKGFYTENTNSIFLDGVHNAYDFDWKSQWGNAVEYRKQYEHPLWAKYTQEGVHHGHGGMDWLVYNAFFQSIEKGYAPPIDTYDTAAWMAVTPLSEASIAQGGAPVAFPDFTHGKWTHRSAIPQWEFSLHR